MGATAANRALAAGVVMSSSLAKAMFKLASAELDVVAGLFINVVGGPLAGDKLLLMK